MGTVLADVLNWGLDPSWEVSSQTTPHSFFRVWDVLAREVEVMIFSFDCGGNPGVGLRFPVASANLQYADRAELSTFSMF